MARKKQRIVLEGFTFSVNKLIIEQESEIDDGPSLHEGVRHAIGRIISAPAELLATESNGVDTSRGASVLPEVPTSDPTKKRRRRTRYVPTGTDSVVASDDSKAETSTARSASKPNSARSLLVEIHKEGFFAQDRSIGEVRDELHTRGHSFKSNEISPVLLYLTKQKTLARRKGEGGGWTYREGTNGQH